MFQRRIDVKVVWSSLHGIWYSLPCDQRCKSTRDGLAVGSANSQECSGSYRERFLLMERGDRWIMMTLAPWKAHDVIWCIMMRRQGCCCPASSNQMPSSESDPEWTMSESREEEWRLISITAYNDDAAHSCLRQWKAEMKMWCITDATRCQVD